MYARILRGTALPYDLQQKVDILEKMGRLAVALPAISSKAFKGAKRWHKCIFW
jgi:hypothetical protein